MVTADFYIFIFKTDFPYFEIPNTLGYLAILFRRYESFFQVASNSQKQTASIRETKHNREMVPDSILLLLLFKTQKSLLKCFCLKNKTMKITL